jgi:DHA1 family bicyclomycin/chloramphenicol resistance-like MFS transporter
MARGTKGLTLLIALVSTLGPYTIDAFFPSLRAITKDFGVSTLQAQQILTVFMVPYAFMSLVHGSLSDALGRRRVMLGALALYILASLGCALAPTFSVLLMFRFMQGMLAGVGGIIGRAVVRDCYSGVQAQRVMSSITMMFALGPALAPVIGGWVHAWLGWRAVFGTMSLFGTIMWLLIAWRLPETHPVQQRSELHLGVLSRQMWVVISNRNFLVLMSSSGLCFIALHGYLGSAPAIVLDHWKLTETGFGALSIPIIGGYAIGAWVSGRIVTRVDQEDMIRFGYNGLLLSTAAMLLLQWWMKNPPVIAQQALLVAIAFTLQFIIPVITLRVLDLFENIRGTAASAQAFVTMLLNALMMGVVAPWLSTTMLRLAIASFLLTLVAWIIWLLKLRRPVSV